MPVAAAAIMTDLEREGSQKEEVEEKEDSKFLSYQ
jgi:hypothetical protein